MRAIILAVGCEGNETRAFRKADEKDTTTTTTAFGFIAKKKEEEGTKGKSATSDVDLLLVFKPLLQYAIESVQKCSLVRECVVCVEKEDAKFAKELCEKMTTTERETTVKKTTTETKVTFEVLEVEGGRKITSRISPLCVIFSTPSRRTIPKPSMVYWR